MWNGAKEEREDDLHCEGTSTALAAQQHVDRPSPPRTTM
jgi:hypothetical protein